MYHMMETHFNTSHVTVYRLSDIIIVTVFHDFNTSHVTVYPLGENTYLMVRRISIHLMLLFIVTLSAYLPPDVHFNTSHVTVYRNDGGVYQSISSFQYISCYCLSG